jgi:hypothetical protein
MLEEAELKRQVKGNRAKEESPKKRKKPSTQNKIKGGSSRQGSIKRKKDQLVARLNLFECSSGE